jgi:hypothetical protein
MEGHCYRQGESVLDEAKDIVKRAKYQEAFSTGKVADVSNTKDTMPNAETRALA